MRIHHSETTWCVGDNGYDSAMGGITYYFGPDANLKDRHRKQDPDSALFDLLHSLQEGCAPVQVTLKSLEPTSCEIYLPPG